jgi:hypothetical protein
VNLRIEPDGETLRFDPKACIIAGFTGRNRAKVQEHIDEMRAHGVPIPESYPIFMPVPVSLITTDRAIEVRTAESSGEVEPVLLACGDEWYITVGSDHTARDLEKSDIAVSKAACPKVLCTQVWRYADVRSQWDRLTLRSWTVENGSRRPYQSATCADILRLEDLLTSLRVHIADLPAEFVMCMGTPPLIDGKFVYAHRYEFELADPVIGRTLTLGYDVRF